MQRACFIDPACFAVNDQSTVAQVVKTFAAPRTYFETLGEFRYEDFRNAMEAGILRRERELKRKMLYLPAAQPHSLQAVEDSSLLVTILLRKK